MDCGGRCLLKVHVKDGLAVRTEGDDTEEPQQLRACLYYLDLKTTEGSASSA